MRTVAIVNQKGGCGKTTVSINLASALAELGKRVLLVDMDPQSHCAVGLAVPEEQIEQSIYDVLISKSRSEPMRLTEILWQIGENLELAPASIDLSAFEQQMAGIPDRECCLRDVLEDVKEEYDFAVVDCPPAVSLLTFNALRASTDVLVPVETGYFALHGLSKQLETLSILCKRCQQHVNVRVLASMYDIRTKMAREILAELRSHFADQMFKTVVNFNTRIKEASSFGQPINEYDPASKGQQDFRMLAQEVIGSDERPQVKSKRLVDSLADQLEAIGASANELLKATKPTPTGGRVPVIEPATRAAGAAQGGDRAAARNRRAQARDAAASRGGIKARDGTETGRRATAGGGDGQTDPRGRAETGHRAQARRRAEKGAGAGHCGGCLCDPGAGVSACLGGGQSPDVGRIRHPDHQSARRQALRILRRQPDAGCGGLRDALSAGRDRRDRR